MGLPYVTISGDTAIALNYRSMFRPDGEGRFYPWRVSGWDLIRQDDGWLIEQRINRPMTGDPDALAMLRHIDAVTARHPLTQD